MIRCRSVSGKTNCEEVEPVDGGYYLNSDPIKPYYPLIYQKYDENEDKKWSAQAGKANGWYLNADKDATNAETIIRCTSKNECTYRELRNVQCSTNNVGEFTKYYGKIQWYDGKGNAQSLIEGSGSIMTYISRNDLIPGISNNGGYALMDITENSVLLNSDKDGYFYSSGNLYFCPKSKKGICTKETIENGYYIEYGNGNLTVYEYTKGDISKCERLDVNDCKISNVIIEEKGGNKKVELCSNDRPINKLEFKKIKNKNMYALEIKSFPGSSEEVDYIRVEVNKYYVKLIKDIQYPNGIGDKDSNCKVEKDSSKCSSDNNEYVYPSDTNYGYWEYNSSEEAYKRIFIPVKNEKGELIGKYDCDIGGLCILKDLDKPSPIDNVFENGVLYIKYSDGTTLPATNIKENSRHYSKQLTTWIICKKNKFVQLKSNMMKELSQKLLVMV